MRYDLEKMAYRVTHEIVVVVGGGGGVRVYSRTDSLTCVDSSSS